MPFGSLFLPNRMQTDIAVRVRFPGIVPALLPKPNEFRFIPVVQFPTIADL